MVFCILLWAKSYGLDSMRHLHRLREGKPGWEKCHISDVQAGARAGARCCTSLCSRWRNPSMNTRRLQSVILFLSFVYFCCKEGASCKRLRKFKLSFMRLCLELIWNCVLRRNLISYCQLIFLCSYMRPCFTCMDAFRQPVCCLCIPPSGLGISLCFSFICVTIK